MSVIKYSILGIVVVSSITAFTTYHNINKIKETMTNNVVEWNSHLPDGFNIRLNNNVNFSGAQGSYILSQKKEEKSIDLFTLNFNAKFNILTLVLPNSKLPISGTGVLSLENINTEEIKYSFDNNNKDFMTFDGFIEKNGNVNINYKQNSYLVGIETEIEGPNQVFFKIGDTTGKFSKQNQDIELTSLTPSFEILDSPENNDGIIMTGMNNSIKMTKKGTTNNTIVSSKIDIIQDMTSKNNKDIIEEGIFKIEGVDTLLEIDDSEKNFKHRVKVNIKSASTLEQKDLQVNLDYDMTVPQESKSAILNLLSSSQNNDLINRQESAFKLFKTGFNINLYKFDFLQNKEIGAMTFALDLAPQNKELLLSDRISFNGNLASNGYASMIFKQLLPFPIDNEEISLDIPAYEKTFSLKFDYNHSELFLNSKRVDKNIEEGLIKSLVGLDILMKEAEEDLENDKANLIKEKNQEDSATFQEENIEEIPGTEDKLES